MLERTVEVGLLLDCYENLLHERTRQVLKEYFSYDLSLNEIADQHSISKQAVSDQVRRGEEKLHTYEKALGLLEKRQRQEDKIQKSLDLLEKYEEEKDSTYLEQTKKLLEEVSNGL